MGNGKKVVHESLLNRISSRRFALGFLTNEAIGLAAKAKDKTEAVSEVVLQYCKEIYVIFLQSQRKSPNSIPYLIDKTE